ncbi:hypothetical protein JEY40_33015 [Bradyrhizobium japonicum]|uniref:hypothetical protein n=1 Tax=Bradyrhizobium TaxID=374 RepID=UPI0012BC25EB|nr:hypothetical protein [Bradyrhizobium japonicum]MCS3894070.1 hypothetical protein [Bradyrhizobium japonicum USDA 38]MCS3946584.1 hypothetical protein [Bradyrhizobium japonicum]MCW2220641.1 hypothetical protein [Bradyrhizobium japonicum]MCW2345255.1 hypothetical protein [Bradyrhizobium japonicum]UQD77643.1 hypothetical protein JEY40_33015 [Bradyrhizobium japonicum]
MSKAKELADRAQAFEKRAAKAIDLSSREHYREMAAHYCALSVEHREAEQLQKLSQAGFEQLAKRSSTPTFQNADRPTFQRAMAVGIVLCVAFVAVSFSLRPQAADDRVLVKADRLMRTAGDPSKVR